MPIFQIRYNCKNLGGVETAIRGTDPSVAGSKGLVVGFAGSRNLDDANLVSCPAGSFVSGIQGFKLNGRNSIIDIRYDCRTPTGEESAVRGTDPEVAAGKGSVEGLSGTYNLDSNIAECPYGSFVSAIQGFKPNGEPQIVDIRYLCTSSAKFDEPINPIQAPGLVVSFEGGVIGDEISQVFDAISTLLGALPTDTYTVKTGESVCTILQARNFPACTKKLEASIDRLNPSLPPPSRALKEGATLILPKVSFKTYRARNSFSNFKPTDLGVAAAIQHNWLKAEALDVAPTRTVIEYSAYDMYIGAKDDAGALALAKAVSPLKSYNISVDALTRTNREPGKVNAAPSNDQVLSECTDNTIGKNVYSYSDLADADTDAIGVVKAELPEQPVAVNVYLVDVPLQISPNLGGAQQPHGTASGSQFSTIRITQLISPGL